ncbi:unnamed protein product [Protopolystoma xenopodis]|uniref:Uncharacterized protein n=1 Tax=Protopolystoma xenopodis TaxID=117903 RepID=A0A448WSJ7_9PLAT|nr:unnamed protein product [Protopolystoma xenopodis]
MDVYTLLRIGSGGIANARRMEPSYFTSLPTRHEEVNKFECSSFYSINYSDCRQKYSGETERTINTKIKEDQRLCGKMDTERSEI